MALTSEEKEALNIALERTGIENQPHYTMIDAGKMLNAHKQRVAEWCFFGGLKTIQLGTNKVIPAGEVARALVNGVNYEKPKLVPAPAQKKRSVDDTCRLILDLVDQYPSVNRNIVQRVIGPELVGEGVERLKADGSLTVTLGGVNGREKQYTLTDKGEREAQQVRAQG